MFNSPPQYENFIFDIGNVLLTWDPVAILRSVLGEQVLIQPYLEHIFKHPDWLAIDRGMLSEKQAIAIFSQRTKLSHSSLRAIFQAAKDSLKPIAESIELLKALHRMNKKLYCLSNMSASSFAYVQHYPFWSLFNAIIISAEVGLSKPDPAIFQYMLTRFKLDIHTSIFIDDMPRNTQSAEKLGIKSIVFHNASHCIKQLEAKT